MSDEIAISVQNLTKVYKLYDSPQDRLKESLHPLRKKYHKDFYALNDVSFEIRKGETVGIIGQNGAGKSTLLKLITGVLTPTSGGVTVNGRISALLELGAGFNPDLTGIENVYFNGTLMGYMREEMDTKLDDILAFADIGDFIYQPVKTYSSGMFVRLAFAVAVHVDPEILIVDEALSVGDMMFQAKCYDRIKSLMSGGVTTLFVTHGMNTITTLCDRAYMFDRGMLHTEGSPKDVTLAYFEFLRKREHDQKEQVKNVHQNIPVKSNWTSNFKNSKLENEYRFGTGAAEVVDFRVLDHEGNETLMLATGQKFTIQVKVDFHDDVDNFAIGAMIRNTQGQNLLGIHSYHDKRMTFGRKSKGDKLLLSLESDMLLNPGKYTLSIGIADFAATDYDYKSLDSRNNLTAIEVYGKEFSYGIINNDYQVHVED